MNDQFLMRTVPEPALRTGGIYLDNQSTTPVDPRVAQVVMDAMVKQFGNANSVDHTHGDAARLIVENGRANVANLLNCDPSDVYFTSGSSEAIRLAICHAIGSAPGLPLKIAASRVEHPALLEMIERARRLGLAELFWIDVNRDGSIDFGSVDAVLANGVDLICVMAANNEVGTIYPIDKIFAAAEPTGAKMLVDATQALGRTRLDLMDVPVDYLVISGHKVYGPKGVGALVSPIFKTEDVWGLDAVHDSTPNVPGISGLGEACRLMLEEGSIDNERIAALRDTLESDLMARIPGLIINGDPAHRLAHNLHLSIPGVTNDLVVQRLRNRVAISTGAACVSGAQSASHVLKAMGLSPELQESALRIGLGRFTTARDIAEASEAIAAAVENVKSVLEDRDA